MDRKYVKAWSLIGAFVASGLALLGGTRLALSGAIVMWLVIGFVGWLDDNFPAK